MVDENLVTELAASGRPRGGGGEFNPARNPNSADLPFREQMIRGYLSRGNAPPSLEKATTMKEVIQKAVHFYSMLQSEDGHWAGDYGGPHFLLPGLIIVWYVMGQPASMFQQAALDLMISYIFRHQQSDGGWGTHLESPSTMFGTTLMYVAIRCLGVDKDHPVCVRGRRFIQEQGGAVMTSSWAKFYLCILGAMEWEGHNVVPAEMWLLPNWCPFHPGRMWCHARMVYRKCKHLGFLLRGAAGGIESNLTDLACSHGSFFSFSLLAFSLQFPWVTCSDQNLFTETRKSILWCSRCARNCTVSRTRISFG